MRRFSINKLVASLYKLFMLLMVLPSTSCTENEVETQIKLYSDESLTLEYKEDSKVTVNFMCTQDWSAYVSDDWLALSSTQGTAGNSTIIVSTLSENNEIQERTATLTIRSGAIEKSIELTQLPSDYVLPGEEEYIMESAGGNLEIRFITNVSLSELTVQFISENMGMWANIEQIQTGSETDSSTEYILNLRMDKNTGSQRTGYVIVSKKQWLMGQTLAQIPVIQNGVNADESTDFSSDKAVTVIQSSTKGKGLPIVLMGDGFLDTDIADGTYERVMMKAYENLFTEEPIASLKEYFDVYYVNAVSKNNLFGHGYETVFSCELEGGGSTGISGNDTAVQEYVQCVEGIDIKNALAVVILNSNEYAGTTYFGYCDEERNYVEFAIAYCPIIYGLENESFREVLCHEAVGHGFAKLEDEYYYIEYGTIGAAAKQQILELQALGWAQNVDFTTDETKVLWSNFIGDSNYDSEGIGIYEGACTYFKGVYRPTENSMMNDNTVGFNAPSRMSIYNRVMEDATGEKKSYDDFVEFDKQTGLSAIMRRTFTRSQTSESIPFARPKMANRKLGDLSR